LNTFFSRMASLKAALGLAEDNPMGGYKPEVDRGGREPTTALCREEYVKENYRPISFTTSIFQAQALATMWLGTEISTSVPAPDLLQILSCAPIFLARSRIPKTPQCESLS
jgi:hypothetical protein